MFCQSVTAVYYKFQGIVLDVLECILADSDASAAGVSKKLGIWHVITQVAQLLQSISATFLVDENTVIVGYRWFVKLPACLSNGQEKLHVKKFAMDK